MRVFFKRRPDHCEMRYSRGCSAAGSTGTGATSAGVRRPTRGRSDDIDPDVDKGESDQHTKDAADA